MKNILIFRERKEKLKYQVQLNGFLERETLGEWLSKDILFLYIPICNIGCETS